MHYRAFAWQNGYGVFSVSQSIVDKTLDYISNQEMHHKRFSFQDEYRQFLLSYGVEYDEAYVFKDEGFCSFRASSHIAMHTQGVASLALAYVLHWAFIDIIGCGSAIQASLIAFALHDDSARPC